MALFLVSYDINHKNENEYPNLWASLKKWGAIKILYSEWIIGGDRQTALQKYAPVTATQNDRSLKNILRDP